MDEKAHIENDKAQTETKTKEHNFLKFLFIIFGYGFGIFVGVVPTLLAKNIGIESDSLLEFFLPIFTTTVGLALLLLIYKYFYTRLFSYANTYSFKKPDGELIVAIFLIAPLFVFLKVVLLNLDNFRTLGVEEFFAIDFEENLSDLTALLLEIPLVAIIAPIFEEYSYRIIPLSSFRTKRGKFVAGSITAICFSFLHGNSFGIVLIDAIIYAFVFFVTKNLWLSIILHIANNLSTILVPALSIGYMLINPNTQYGVMGSPIPVFAVFAICFIIGVSRIVRYYKMTKDCGVNTDCQI